MLLLAYAYAMPVAAQSLFGRQVDVQFATQDGKPLANAEVRVFAPDNPGRAVATGRTDAQGRFTFGADRDGFWSAEARDPGNEVARVRVRVGGADFAADEPLSPLLLIGLLGILLVIAVWYRLLRARAGARKPRA